MKREGGAKYQSFFDSCGVVVKEEGFWSLFAGVVPNMLQTFVARMMRTAIPLFIERTFGVDPDGFLFVFIELILGNLELIFTLPLETIRHRLQSQRNVRTIESSFDILVETSRIPYTGVLDCLNRILEEEGVFALYRGWAPHIASNFMLTVLTLISDIQIDVEEIEEEDVLL